ncbi:MAG: carboxylesterase family protein [Candidatus Limiplasma sp.]|nr:carboxylesterase family protein [Candidatus Limiplasma sp.]
MPFLSPKEAEIQANHGRKPVYVFSFAHPDPIKGSAYHSLETHYLQGHYATTPESAASDALTAQAIQEYWCNFVKTGNPNGPKAPQWRPYTAQDRSVLCFAEKPENIVEDENDLQRFAREFAVQQSEALIAKKG